MLPLFGHCLERIFLSTNFMEHQGTIFPPPRKRMFFKLMGSIKIKYMLSKIKWHNIHFWISNWPTYFEPSARGGQFWIWRKRQLTTKEFSLIFRHWIVVNEFVLPFTTEVNVPELFPFTKWSLIVNKGSWLETVDTDSGVVGGVCCEFWNWVAWKNAVVEGITTGALVEVVTGVLTARSRCTAAWAAWTTAADTAVLKPAGDVGRGPSRSCKRRYQNVNKQLN